MAVIEPCSSVRREVIVFMGYDAWLDPFEIQRFRLLADRWHARVVIPETPGCSLRPSRVTGAEASDLVSGEFRVLGNRMLRLARAHLRDQLRLPTHLVGYSMGASVAAASISDSSNWRPQSVTLIEPVALHTWSVGQIVSAVRRENNLNSRYLEANASWRGTNQPPNQHGRRGPKRHRTSQLLQANALRAGRIPNDILEAHQRRSAGVQAQPVIVVHGEESRLSTLEGNNRMLGGWSAAGLHATDIAMPGSHGIWQSLNCVETLAGRIVETWDSL